MITKKMNASMYAMFMCALLLFATACNKEEETPHDCNGGKIGMLFAGKDNQFLEAVLIYGVKYAATLNVPYELDISTTADQQETAFAAMIKKGIKTFVIVNKGISTESINKAVADGVNVVLYDEELDCNYSCFVTNSQTDMGGVPGEYIKKTKATNIVAIDIATVPEFSKPRLEAFKKALDAEQKVTVVSVDAYTQSAGTRVVDQIAAINPDALWAQDDQILMGMLYAGLVSKIPNLKYIASGTGFQPLLTMIKDEQVGVEVAVATYSPQTIERAIDIAADLMKGKKPSEKRVIIPSQLITKENVSQYIKDGLVY